MTRDETSEFFALLVEATHDHAVLSAARAAGPAGEGEEETPSHHSVIAVPSLPTGRHHQSPTHAMCGRQPLPRRSTTSRQAGGGGGSNEVEELIVEDDQDSHQGGQRGHPCCGSEVCGAGRARPTTSASGTASSRACRSPTFRRRSSSFSASGPAVCARTQQLRRICAQGHACVREDTATRTASTVSRHRLASRHRAEPAAQGRESRTARLLEVPRGGPLGHAAAQELPHSGDGVGGRLALVEVVAHLEACARTGREGLLRGACLSRFPSTPPSASAATTQRFVARPPRAPWTQGTATLRGIARTAGCACAAGDSSAGRGLCPAAGAPAAAASSSCSSSALSASSTRSSRRPVRLATMSSWERGVGGKRAETHVRRSK